jgi:hypothetical protein
VLVGISLAACFSKPPRPDGTALPTDGGPDPGVDGFSKRRLVEIDTGLTSSLANVPIVVRLRSDGEIAAAARSDGSDIVASVDGETLLASEVAMFTSGGDLELWVEIPELAPQMSFHIYYGGNATATRSPWDPTRFAGVWHLSESTTDAPDSTGRNTLNANGIVGHEAGVFGDARSFGGGSGLNGGNPAELAFGMDSFSYSLWVNQSANNDPYDIVLYKGCAKPTEPGFCYLVGTEPWSPKLMDTTGEFADPEITTGPVHDTWVHLAAVVDRPTELRGYVDGLRQNTDSTVGAIGSMTNDQPFQISRPDIFFTGLVDEVRIYRGVLEDDWIELEHTMGTNPGFATVGAEESLR